jgi:hypothetical protein
VTIFANLRSIRQAIATLSARFEEPMMRGLAHALADDRAGYLALAERLDEPRMIEVARAAAAHDTHRLVYLIPMLIFNMDCPLLSQLTVLLGDPNQQLWASHIMSTWNERFYASFPSILSGDAIVIDITYCEYVSIKPTGTATPLEILERLETYYLEKDPDDEEAEPIVTDQDRLLLATAALALAPE